jgi:hypothetical protein
MVIPTAVPLTAVPRESVLPGPHWLLKVQLIDSSDPRYETRLESGGLLPTDPLAHELGAMLTLESPIPDTVREQMADEFMWPDGERDVSARPGMIDAGRISITVRGRDGEERPLPVDPFQE